MESDKASPPVTALIELGIVEDRSTAKWTALSGGVSSDIWRVDLPDRTLCVKRARPVLAVAAEWHAPVERSESEVAWLKVAGEIEPRMVPEVVGHLPDEHLFVMAHLDPERYPVWKQELAAGRVDSEFARQVGERLGLIHSRTAGDDALAERFATDDLFASLRLEPYFDTTAIAHPDLAAEIDSICRRTAATRLALVHGDVSPKNLLVGPGGPVFLDAECAWFGDPAFDAAFCMTHLLLKCLWVPEQSAALLASFDEFFGAYLAQVDWEPYAELERRVAALLPALLLARVDGKSPVEYLTDETSRDVVRVVARELIGDPVNTIDEVHHLWKAKTQPW